MDGQQGWVNKTCRSARPLVWIGAISYSLYLWHWPIIVLGVDWRGGGGGGGGDGAAGGAAAAVLSVVPAWLSYRFIEQPTRKGLTNRPWISLLLAGNLTLASLCSGLGVVVVAMGRGRGGGGGGGVDHDDGRLHQLSLAVLGGHVRMYPKDAGAGAIIINIKNNKKNPEKQQQQQQQPLVPLDALFPHPSLAWYDKPGEGKRCLVGVTGTHPRWCTFGDHLNPGAVDVVVGPGGLQD